MLTDGFSALEIYLSLLSLQFGQKAEKQADCERKYCTQFVTIAPQLTEVSADNVDEWDL